MLPPIGKKASQGSTKIRLWDGNQKRQKTFRLIFPERRSASGNQGRNAAVGKSEKAAACREGCWPQDADHRSRSLERSGLALLRRKGGDKTRIDDVGWRLWTLGYAVTERFWRGPFEQAHRSFRDVQSVGVEPNEPGDDSPPILSDTIELLIGQVVNLPDVPTQLGLTRRMLGPELQQLINALGRDEIDLVAFTSASQASNLFTVAQYNGKEASLKQSLGRTLVASIGPGVQRRAPQARREGRYRSTTAEAGAVY